MRNRLPSKTARIVRFHKIGPPEVLQLDELPLPAPDNAEVRLRVKAIGLNRAEVNFRQGRYRFPIPKDSDQTDTYRHNSMSGMGFTDELSDPTNRT